MSTAAKRDSQHSSNSSEQVQAVRGCEDVEEAAARVRREINAGGGELPPGENLAREKEQSQNCSDAPPVAETCFVLREEIPARARKSETAAEKNERVQPKDTRDFDRLPGYCGEAFAHHERAHERREEHENAAESDQHSGDVGSLRDCT